MNAILIETNRDDGDVSTAPDTSRGVDAHRVAIAVLALCSLGAAALHFAVFGDHFEEYWLYGVFFATVAWCQAIWAAWVVYRPSPRLLLAGNVGNALIIAVWIASRTVGIGIGPQVGPEAITAADTLCTLLELAVVAGAAALLALPFRARITRRMALSTIGSVALLVVLASTAVLATAPSHEHDASHNDEVAVAQSHTHTTNAHDTQEVPR